MFSWSAPSIGKIPCPAQDACSLKNCLFDHEGGNQRSTTSLGEVETNTGNKRRKLNDSSQNRFEAKSVPVSDASSFAATGLAADLANAKRQTSDSIYPADPNASSSDVTLAARDAQKPAVTLTPKILSPSPNGHGMRYLYLRRLHELMCDLHEKLSKSLDGPAQVIASELDAAALIEMAVEEEAKIATNEPKSYANLIKNRIYAYSKMTTGQFVQAISNTLPPPLPNPAAKKYPRESDADLEGNDARKRSLLKKLICSQEGLAKHGYVTTLPTAVEIEEALAEEETAKGYETCSRCGTWFPVFLDRREDGALTGGGKCYHHIGRLQGEKAASRKQATERKYVCCGESAEKPGCTETATHVFEIKSAARQSLVLSFMHTPENDSVDDERVVAIDCEMGYTTRGNELIRMTALSWPSGKVLLDFLVRPFGTVLDLNTQYSGVKVADFVNAAVYDGTMEELQIVSSPFRARQLLFQQIKPSTPLIGHAIENDLNALRIVHPTLIDTVLLCPHPGGKLPRRRALRELARQYLGRTIQVPSQEGHDSHEDALATADVVTVLVKMKWHELKRNGWFMRGDEATSPKTSLRKRP